MGGGGRDEQQLMMDVESVRSGHSERSGRSGRDRYSHRGSSHNPAGGESLPEEGRPPRRSHHGREHNMHARDRYSETGRETDQDDMTDREDRRGRNHYRGNNTVHSPSGPLMEGTDPLGQGTESERVAVQIIPQGDDWGETTTAVSGYTGATSDTGTLTGFSTADMGMPSSKSLNNGLGFNCCIRNAPIALAFLICFLAFVSPIVMVVLPIVNILNWETEPCGPKCEGLFLSYAMKLIILLIGSWAVFMRKPKAVLPRIFLFRAVILFLVFVITFAFWLFYGVRIIEKKDRDYYSIVLFAGSLVDGLLFIHYLAVILVEVRQLQRQYVVKILRSPDGEARCYTVGQLSIQRLATFVLEKYYQDFPTFNPYLDNIPKRPPKMEGTFTVYDIDGNPSNNAAGRSRAVFAATARRRDSGHNDRFYEVEEYERRVRKRRARLIVAAEEAFTHIKRLQEDTGTAAIQMTPEEAAAAIFPSLARALQKYLRITRQQLFYSLQDITEHLAQCLANSLSPKAFLERYLKQSPVVWNNREYDQEQTWVVICDTMLSRATAHDTTLQLQQGDITLMVSVRKLPHYNLTEQVVDPKTNRFVLRLNSETSV